MRRNGAVAALRVEKIGRAAEPTRTYERGRVCACGNRISIYNSGNACALCVRRDPTLAVAAGSARAVKEHSQSSGARGSRRRRAKDQTPTARQIGILEELDAMGPSLYLPTNSVPALVRLGMIMRISTTDRRWTLSDTAREFLLARARGET